MIVVCVCKYPLQHILCNHSIHPFFSQHILSDIAAYSATVEQASTLGNSLIDDSKPEESQKVTGRLEALRTQFRQLETAAQTRMSRLETALKCAATYEDEGSEFAKWLVETEGRLNSLEQLPIASQPLKQQLQDVKVHNPHFSHSLYIKIDLTIILVCSLTFNQLTDTGKLLSY